jgi:plastocyanin
MHHKFFVLITLFVIVQFSFAEDTHMMHGVMVSGSDYAFKSPNTLETGYQTLTFTNTGKEVHHLQLARLNDGVTLEQFQAAMQESEFAALPLLEFVGGVGVIAPGQTATTTIKLEKPGTYLELCFISNAEGVPHLALGTMKSIEVVAATEVATEVPKADLRVDMVDFAFAIPAALPSGEQVWEIVNHGPQLHELQLVKIKEGKTVQDVMTYFQSPVQGPDTPFETMGGAQGLSTGHSNFVSFELTPGEYVALCLIPDPESAQAHIALGMVSHFRLVK